MYRSNAYSSTGSGQFANHVSNEFVRDEHEGIDIVINETWWCSDRGRNIGYIRNVPLYGQGTGMVTRRAGGLNVRSGFLVDIEYNGNAIIATYMHLRDNPQHDALLTDNVNPSTRIGITSDTGVLADPRTGNHLHLEVRVGGRVEDPRDFFPTGTFRNRRP